MEIEIILFFLWLLLTTSAKLPLIKELAISKDSMSFSQTFIQQSNKTIKIIYLYEFSTFIGLKNCISEISHMKLYHLKIN